MTALWGLLASLTSSRIAIAVAGVLLLVTPVLLPDRESETENARNDGFADIVGR
jgi:hypothetical protein